MAQGKLEPSSGVFLQDGFWKLRWPEDVGERKPAWIGPAEGPERLTRKEAERVASEIFPSRPGGNARAPQSTVTVADFVEKVFVPEHVATKNRSGRTHYQAILKHVLTPEEVDRVFRVDREKSKAKLKALPNWPYLSEVRLCDARPDHVQRLIAAAVAHGYSAQTVRHIRNVANAIFAHARKKQCLAGDNPARFVKLPRMIREEAHALTLAQAKEVLAVMRYPERELALIAILTSMSLAEICGLQWKCVNLTEARSGADGELAPPRSIAVRKQWYRGELGGVGKPSRNRNLAIPEPLLPVLLALRSREGFTGPDDFVLVTAAGRPIDERRIAVRRLKRIGQDLHVPWLTWRVFRRTHVTLAGLYCEDARDTGK